MLIIWRGLGFLVAVVTFGFALGANLLANKFRGDGYWEQHAWPMAAALAVSGAVCWVLGRRLNKPARKENGDNRRLWTHDLFFVRMEWWAYPLVAMAVAAVVLNFTPGNATSRVKAAVGQTAKAAK
jgi:hypothetical protein